MKQIHMRDYEIRIQLHDTREVKIHNLQGRNIEDAVKASKEQFKHLYGTNKYNLVSIKEVP